ncbi:hypothetical protein A6M27_15230 [Acidithiobacillus thiooxidans]|nr:hypothetical protein A6M27_15230 [Acidithiobacillus thiooxidans]OCX85780.1 hypothetical protein A6O26_00090 [Acidithiobacillus thiooxidans]
MDIGTPFGENDAMSENDRDTEKQIRLHNLRILIEIAAGGNQTRFAEMAGKRQSYFSNVLSDPKKSFGRAVASDLERRFADFGLTRFWMEMDRRDKDPKKYVNENKPAETVDRLACLIDAFAETPALPPKVPLVHWEYAGSFDSSKNHLWRAGVTYLVGVDKNPSENCFSLEIKGDSFGPTFRDGDQVVVDPDAKWASGNFVVVACRELGGVSIKRAIREDGEWWVASLDPQIPARKLDEFYRKIGKITWIQSKAIAL